MCVHCRANPQCLVAVFAEDGGCTEFSAVSGELDHYYLQSCERSSLHIISEMSP